MQRATTTAIGCAAAVATLLLAACSGPSAPVPTADATVAADPTTESVASPTAAASEAAAPGGLTAPGTRLAIGETAVLHTQALAEGDEYYGYVEMDSKVVAIEQGDPAVFAQFENAADFADLVPYYVRAEHVIRVAEGQPNKLMTPLITGLYSDGTEARGVVSFSGFGDVCSTDNFESIAVGQTATTCTVSLAEAGGREVTGAQWVGDDYADGPDNPYKDAPVTWGS